MKTQIRNSVFETNSSSSHSVTIDRNEIVDFAIHKDILRTGVIKVCLSGDGYGWEWVRYRSPSSKIAYILTQLAGGYLPSGASDLKPDEDHIDLFRDDVRAAWFIDVIENATGCRVEVTRSGEEASWGYSIDHQSVGKGVDEIWDEDAILKLVFGRNSYIETGNDNSVPPEIIANDMTGAEQYFEQILVGSVPDGVQFRLLEHYTEGRNKKFDIRTMSRGLLSTPAVNWEFRRRVHDLLAEGDVVISGFAISVPYREDANENRFREFARRTAFESWIDLFMEARSLHLLRDFAVDACRVPYLHTNSEHARVIHDTAYAAQAEVTLLGCARDDTVDKLFRLFASAVDYAPPVNDVSP